MLLLQATGLTGLAVANNPHHTLTVLYGKVLRALQKMPSSAAYRKYTEELINERAQIVKNVSLMLKTFKVVCMSHSSYSHWQLQ